MRLSGTSLIMLAVLALESSHAFVIPLYRVNSTGLTSRDLHARHKHPRPHGHQQHDFVTVYTTVMGPPPQETQAANTPDDSRKCKGGVRGGDKKPETQQPPGEPVNPPGFIEQSDTAPATENNEFESSGDPKDQDASFENPTDTADEDSSSTALSADMAPEELSPSTSPASATHSEVPSAEVPAAKQPEGKAEGSNLLIQSDQENLVALHNAIREANGQGKLEWDDKLAEFAAGWTAKCVSHHDHSGGPYGENMGGGSGKPDPKGMIKMWTDEQSEYQCAQPSSADFPKVGHYTALMWKEVKYVGCSLQQCSSMGDGSNSMPWHWSCNYWPAPNMMSDTTDYYKENVPCTRNKPDELA